MTDHRHQNDMGLPGRLSALFGMLWLAYPISELFGDPSASTLRKVVVLAVVAGFCTFVLWRIFEDDGPEDELPTLGDVLRTVAILASIDAALALLDRAEWAAVMSVYVAAFVAMGIPGKGGLAGLAVVAVASYFLMVGGGWTGSQAGGQTAALLAIGVTLAGVGQIIRTNRALRLARAELARVAVADERRRFARDLHDLLGHSLSMIAIKARLAQRVQDTDPARAAQEIADIETAARTSLAEVRETVSGYRRATIAGELVGVRAALESAGVALDTRVTRMALDAEDEAVLAWALREATTNIVRHADARRVVVRLEPAGEGARLEVEDDGHGANGNGAPNAERLVGAGGHGLHGLAERVAERAGRLETGAGHDGGFKLAVELPGTITV
jgi:two-component system sensor histidine kinase DesK